MGISLNPVADAQKDAAREARAKKLDQDLVAQRTQRRIKQRDHRSPSAPKEN